MESQGISRITFAGTPVYQEEAGRKYLKNIAYVIRKLKYKKKINTSKNTFLFELL